MYRLLRALLFLFPAEAAHQLGIAALEILSQLPGVCRWMRDRALRGTAELSVTIAGLKFANCIGLAAGLDKNAEAAAGFFALGFGAVEVGTVTPRPQPGNPKPRLFRIPEQRAVINRMGFNNRGAHEMAARIRDLDYRPAPLGVNIGKNKDTPNESAESDYLYCLERVYPLADYITVNISSPNTAGLRELQEEQALRRLVGTLREAQERLGAQHGKRVPMLVKVAPDLSDDDIEAAARVLGDLEVDGVIATNTTIARTAIPNEPLAGQSGGLSGAPLMNKSTAVLRMLRTRLPEHIPLIGVGGILSGADAAKKMAAGATLVQLYSGLIYRGPKLIGECVEAMRRRKEAPSRGNVPPDH